MVKLAIAGSGMIVKEALPLLSDLEYEITAICGTERSRDKLEALCRMYHAKPYTSYEAMLEEAACDAVYVGLPNHLHHVFAKKALLAGKHVILEKPLTCSISSARDLYAIAEEKKVFLFEAITTVFLPAFLQMREWMNEIGAVRIVNLNYSQYSSRYDRFKQGIIDPVFDASKAGGALGDLNIYNIHLLAGLFPDRLPSVSYLANVERGVDTSGILTLDYGDFKAVCIGAKDCAAPISNTIQGDQGYIRTQTPANALYGAILHKNKGEEISIEQGPGHRMIFEFRQFKEALENRDEAFYERLKAHSLLVMEIYDRARKSAGIEFLTEE